MKTYRSILGLLGVLAVLAVCMAPVSTITEPSADQQQKDLYNRRMRASNVVTLDTGAKYATVVVKLAPAVNQPGDYGALKTAIEQIAGIQSISLMVDGQAPAAIPADHELNLYTTVHLRIDPTPE